MKLRHKTPVEWAISDKLVDYENALAFMESRADEIRQNKAAEMVWLLEHPPLYTGGVRAKASDLRDPDRFPVFQTNRGGEYTYHGPGQRVAYVMIDLAQRGRDVRAFVAGLEQWIINAIGEFSVVGEIRPDRVGVWVKRGNSGEQVREDKIAAIGVRIRKWVSFHGIALNVEPDLTHFSGITPCGIKSEDFGVTSLVDLGLPITFADVDAALKNSFDAIFAPTIEVDAPNI